MIQWVFEAAMAAGVTDDVVVATPDAEIQDVALRFGATVVMTSLNHPSGTDRIAEVAETRVSDAYLNVQGDEPLVAVESIRECAGALVGAKDVAMSSVFTICPRSDSSDRNIVKVVTDLQGDALYFSRSDVPFDRSGTQHQLKRHIGIYCYKRQVLQEFATWTPTELETTEGLEQLRFLEHGVKIRMALGQEGGPSVDTPEQAEAVRAVLNRQP